MPESSVSHQEYVEATCLGKEMQANNPMVVEAYYNSARLRVAH